MSIRFPLALAVTATLLLPAAASAQSPAVWHRQRVAAAALAPAEAGTATPGLAVASGGTRREGRVLMIVGVAGIVTGLIIDEDLVTFAGIGVAGFGLYLYLNNGGSVTVSGRHPL